MVLLLSAASTGDNVLQQLHISQPEADDYFLRSVQYQRLSFPAAAGKLAPQARMEVMKGLLPMAKTYLQSATFKQRYADWWKEQEPEAPLSVEARLKKAEEEDARNKQLSDEAETNLRKQAAEATDPQMKKIYEEALAGYLQSKKQMEDMQKDPEMKEMMQQSGALRKQQFEEDFKKETAQYNKEKADWLAKKDPTVVIKSMLKQYITLTATVDFNAQLTTNQYGKKVFVSSDYQGKSSDWKMCFRAGREVNEFAKTFAQQWLTELKWSLGPNPRAFAAIGTNVNLLSRL